MCGIVGFVGFADAVQQARIALDSIAYRGRDGQHEVSGKNFCIAHCLHRIVGNVPQPIERGDLILAANCEIYNWEELKERYRLSSQNDAEVMIDLFSRVALNEESIKDVLSELDGVFAFALYDRKEHVLVLARDLLGVKPLWFSYEEHRIKFASEKKALGDAEELNPRKIALFSENFELLDRRFFGTSEKPVKDPVKHITQRLRSALGKRVPLAKFGLLFSGGLDSTILACLLKCPAYMTVFGEKHDAEAAKGIARKVGVPLKVIQVSEEQVDMVLPEVIEAIESADPVRVEVATTLWFALEEARKDGVKVMFSGLGADDLFAGYKRMRMAEQINADSLSSLRRMYERDLYRDDTISMRHTIELRLPFLDKELVEYVLSVPSKEKVNEELKPLLRKVARELGMGELAMAKRKAAQYGSGMHRAIGLIAKRNGFENKATYLASLTDVRPLRVGVLFSSGKDSTYALHVQKRLNYDVACLITIRSENQDSFMFHTPSIEYVEYQAKALNVPVVFQETKGIEEEELEDLREALRDAKEKYDVEGIVTGALYSNYQRSRVERLCDELNLKVFSPLWHVDQETEMRSLVRGGFTFILTKVAAAGLDRSWLGRVMTEEDVDRLVRLNEELGMNVAGEGGEFESFVLDAPLFSHKLEIVKSHVVEDEDTAVFVIDELRMIEK